MSVEGAVAGRPIGRGGIDRLFYPGMAFLLVAVALVGFAPRSTAILSGAMANPPLVVHMHAAVMASWVLLLAAQASLSVVGRMDLHRALGLAALALAPAVVVMLTLVTVARQTDAAGTPAAAVVNNILFLQIRSIVLFPTFFIWAMATRRSDAQTHKRMMLLATIMLIDAAIARMSWLPLNAFPASYVAIHAYTLLLIVPGLIYDQLRLGRIHKAWVWGLAIYLPWIVASEIAWDSAWWRALGPRLVGAS
jgi:hypothetical protein